MQTVEPSRSSLNYFYLTPYLLMEYKSTTCHALLAFSTPYLIRQDHITLKNYIHLFHASSVLCNWLVNLGNETCALLCMPCWLHIHEILLYKFHKWFMVHLRGIMYNEINEYKIELLYVRTAVAATGSTPVSYCPSYFSFFSSLFLLLVTSYEATRLKRVTLTPESMIGLIKN